MTGCSPDCPSASILLPHEFLAAVYQKGDAFLKCISPDKSKLVPFWDIFQKHPSIVSRLIRLVPHWKARIIALGVDGGEVPVQGIGKLWPRCSLVFAGFSIMAAAVGVGFQDCYFLFIYIYIYIFIFGHV